jgi:hypothetical protein
VLHDLPYSHADIAGAYRNRNAATGLLSFMPGLFVSAIATLSILSAASIAFFLLVEKPCMDPTWPLRVRNFASDGKQVAERAC